jgi:hypothetical protein
LYIPLISRSNVTIFFVLKSNAISQVFRCYVLLFSLIPLSLSCSLLPLFWPKIAWVESIVWYCKHERRKIYLSKRAKKYINNLFYSVPILLQCRARCQVVVCCSFSIVVAFIIILYWKPSKNKRRLLFVAFNMINVKKERNENNNSKKKKKKLMPDQKKKKLFLTWNSFPQSTALQRMTIMYCRTRWFYNMTTKVYFTLYHLFHRIGTYLWLSNHIIYYWFFIIFTIFIFTYS